MPTKNDPDRRYTDDYGIERAHQDEPGAIDKLRAKHEWFDHIMRMMDRFGSMGGNQYAAGITYFSVLAMFPLMMLAVATMAAVLSARPDLFQSLQDQITSSLPGEAGDTVKTVLDQAIDQRGAIAGIGGLTALWSGLGWMNNLRYGVSKMWRVDPTAVGNFVVNKLQDLLGLIGLLVALVITFGVTTIGNSGLTTHLLEMVGLDAVPGIRYITLAVAVIVGIAANFILMAFMVFYLPRTKVPRRSGLKAAFIGAIIFEVLKQFFSVIASSAFNNPAGATFGPIIGLMILFYLVWRIVLYVSAWAATTEESLAQAKLDAPAPAIIRVRNEVRESSGRDTVRGMGIAAGIAAATAAAFAIFNRK